MARTPVFAGIMTVGERGQAVIPSVLRREWQIKAGDRLLVFTVNSEGILLVKTGRFENTAKKITRALASTDKKRKTRKKTGRKRLNRH